MVELLTTDQRTEALVMPDSVTASCLFARTPLPLQATFDGGRLTSDQGPPEC